MNTNLELLKLAAKAANFDVNFDDYTDAEDWFAHGYDPDTGDVDKWWNPLRDDGDALRLAIKLNLDIYHYPRDNEPHVAVHDEYNRFGGAIEDYDGNSEIAMRRAIVRCAAQIGEAMP